MNLEKALKKGNNRARRTIWSSPNCYLKHITRTPIYQLWDRHTQQEVIHCETPQMFLWLEIDNDKNQDWEPFVGVIDKADREMEIDLSDIFREAAKDVRDKFNKTSMESTWNQLK